MLQRDCVGIGVVEVLLEVVVVDSGRPWVKNK